MSKSDEFFKYVKTLRSRKSALEEGNIRDASLSSPELQAQVQEWEQKRQKLLSQVGPDRSLGEDSLLFSRLFVKAGGLCKELRELRENLEVSEQVAEAWRHLSALEELQLRVYQMEVYLEERESSPLEKLLAPVRLEPLPLGTIIGKRYKTLELLDSCGTGAVYIAEDTRTPQKWAVKEFWGGREFSEELKSVYVEKVRALSGLRHPSLPRIVDNFEQEGRFYVVMDLIKGQSLVEALEAHGPTPLDVALEVCLAVAKLFSFLHSQGAGFVVGGMKPSQVLLTETGVTVVGFGLSRFFLSEDEKPSLFVSPNSTDPLQFSVRDDVYSLGANFHFMLTGKAPELDGETVSLEPLHTGGVPEELSLILKTSLYRDPDKRYGSAEEFFQKLSQFHSTFKSTEMPAVPEAPAAAAEAPERPVEVVFVKKEEKKEDVAGKESGIMSFYKSVKKAVKGIYTPN